MVCEGLKCHQRRSKFFLVNNQELENLLNFKDALMVIIFIQSAGDRGRRERKMVEMV